MIQSVECDAYAYPACYRGDFQSNDTLLTDIWFKSAYTLRLCMHEFLLDGVKRDRLPWAGDLAMSMMVNAYTFRDPEIVRRTLAILGRAGIAEEDVNGIADYSLWWVISQDRYQLYFGDMEHLQREWPRIKNVLKEVESRCDENGLFTEGLDWLFIDWTNIEKENALQVLWWWAQESAVSLAERMNDPQTAAYWQKKADSLKKCFTSVAMTRFGRHGVANPMVRANPTVMPTSWRSFQVLQHRLNIPASSRRWQTQRSQQSARPIWLVSNTWHSPACVLQNGCCVR